MTKNKVGPSDSSDASEKPIYDPKKWYTFEGGKPIEHDPNFHGPLEKRTYTVPKIRPGTTINANFYAGWSKATHHKWPDDLGAGNNPYLQHRSCTDVICCFFFAFFIAAWIFLGFLAFTYGNPERLLHPSDSLGRICGTEVHGHYNLTDKKFLYFFDLVKCASYSSVFEGCPTAQVCVKECPQHHFSYLALQSQEAMMAIDIGLTFEKGRDMLVCTTERKKRSLHTFAQVEEAVRRDECTAYVVKSSPVVGRCIPALLLDIGNEVLREEANNMTRDENNNNSTTPVADAASLADSEGFVKAMLTAKGYGEKILEDLNTAWDELVIGLALAALIAFIWILVMRWIAGIVIWFSIIGIIAAFSLMAAFGWNRYVILKDNPDAQPFEFTLRYREYYMMTDLFYWASLVVSIVLVILVFVVLCLLNRIRIGIAMIVESSKALTSMISALFFPIIPVLLQVVVFAYWALVATWLASYGEENCRRLDVPQNESVVELGNGTERVWENHTWCDCANTKSDEDPYCVFVNYTKDSDLVFYAQAFNLFGFFWGVSFAEALCSLTLAGAFASWYWAFTKPDDVPAMPVLRGFYRAIRYHLGSIAFGSLILAIIRFIRAILEYLEEKLKKADNPVTDALMKGLKCLFWCLEKFVRFLSTNAYIMMAIHGQNFCTSARDSFLLLMRNVLRVFVLGNITSFLLFIGKAFITTGMGVLAWYYFTGELATVSGRVELEIRLNYYWVPVIIIVGGTYFICNMFFDVYEVAVSTTFLSFLEDSERNDGSPQKPFFMSQRLMEILNKRNTFTEGAAVVNH